jgi:DNA-binding LacI/PurR family transcriptional regulator
MHYNATGCIKIGDEMTPKSIQTIADIARLASVSKSTVSRALNDSPLLSAETKERVRAIARAQNFQINQPAQRLSRQESRTIAFVTHGYHHEFSFNDLFTLEILSSIARGLSEAHYDLLMVQVDPHNCCEWVQDYLDSGRADGFILMVSARKSTQVKTLYKMKVPFIVWGALLPGYNYPTVIGDDFNGGRLAAEHLIKAGRRKIAFLGGPEDELEVQGRYHGFDTVLREAGLPIDPKRRAHGDYSNTSGAEAMRELLERDPDLDGVFVNSDVMATAAMDTLRKSGRNIPEDVAVIGYDNLSIAEFTNPPLTTVSQNLPLAGRLLARNLIDHLQTGVVTNMVVPVELVVRNSA